MKILEGDFIYGNTVVIELDNGAVIKRKVRYESLEGLYVLIDGDKIGIKSFSKAQASTNIELTAEQVDVLLKVLTTSDRSKLIVREDKVAYGLWAMLKEIKKELEEI